MTTVNTQTMPATGNPGNLPSLPAFTAFGHLIRGRVALAPSRVDPLARQQAIENALCLALWHIRQDVAPKNIHAATVKAVRAAAMLKQACADLTTTGVTA